MIESAPVGRSERLAAVLESAGRLDDALAQKRGLSGRASRSRVETAAAEFLQRLDELDDRDLVSLDSRVRSWSEYLHWGTGRHLERGFVAPDASTVQAAAAAAAFAASGYARERACRALGGFMPWSFRLLVIRVSDWVPEVRRVALDALTNVHPRDMATHLGLVERLAADRSRSDEMDQLIEAVLNTDAGLAELSELRRAPDPVARRTAWRLLLRWSPDPTRTQLAGAARDQDPWLRRWALSHAREGGTMIALEIATALRSDPIGLLRARGLTLETELGTADQNSLAAALSDRSGAVRSVAQYHLAADAVNAARLYRERLGGEPAVGDILGIGEVGNADDTELARRWLADPRPRYRQAALITTARLIGRDAASESVRLLDDPSPRVASTATRLLGASRLSETVVAELEMRAATGSPRTRRGAVVLLRPYPWRWLLAIMRCLDEPDRETSAFVRAELVEWHRRSASLTFAPPDDAAAEIRDRLSTIDAKSARSIAFVLRTTVPR